VLRGDVYRFRVPKGIGHEQHGTTVDAAGKADADRAVDGSNRKPFRHFVVERSNVGFADDPRLGQHRVSFGREESPVRWVGIWAAKESDLGDVVSRGHSRVRRVKLIG